MHGFTSHCTTYIYSNESASIKNITIKCPSYNNLPSSTRKLCWNKACPASLNWHSRAGRTVGQSSLIERHHLCFKTESSRCLLSNEKSSQRHGQCPTTETRHLKVFSAFSPTPSTTTSWYCLALLKLYRCTLQAGGWGKNRMVAKNTKQRKRGRRGKTQTGNRDHQERSDEQTGKTRKCKKEKRRSCGRK